MKEFSDWLHVANRGESLTYSVIVADESAHIRDLFRSLPATTLDVRACVRTKSELVLALNRGDYPADAVLCDTHFAGEFQGARLMLELRELGVLTAHTAIVLTSDDSRRSTMLGSIDAEPDALLLKPFKVSTLLTKLQSLSGNRKMLAPELELEHLENWAELISLTDKREYTSGQYAVVNKLRAKALVNLGRYDEGLLTARMALQANPQMAWAMEVIAHGAYRTGDLVAAEEQLQKLLKLHPYYVSGKDLLVTILQELKEFERAQHIMSTITMIGPKGTMRNRSLGHIAFLNNDLLTAALAYRRVLDSVEDASSTQVDDLINTARVLMIQGDRVATKDLIELRSPKMRSIRAFQALQEFVSAFLLGPRAGLRDIRQTTVYGMQVMREMPAISDSLYLAAIEACLRAYLPEEAAGYTRDALSHKSPVLGSNRPAVITQTLQQAQLKSEKQKEEQSNKGLFLLM